MESFHRKLLLVEAGHIQTSAVAVGVLLDGERTSNCEVDRSLGERTTAGGNGSQSRQQLACFERPEGDVRTVEYLWAWLKQHALANFCPANLDELDISARNKLKSAQRPLPSSQLAGSRSRFGDVATYGRLNCNCLSEVRPEFAQN